MVDENITDLARQNELASVIELMFTGLTKKKACAEVGIAESTFDRGLATHPEMIAQMHIFVRARFNTVTERIVSEHVSNVEAVSNFLSRLRDQMEGDDIDDAIKALAALVKADKLLERTLATALPAEISVNEKPLEPDTDAPPSKTAAAILERLNQGASLRTTILTRIVEEDREIIHIPAGAAVPLDPERSDSE